MTTDNPLKAARAYAEQACCQDENRPIAEAGFRAGWKAARAHLAVEVRKAKAEALREAAGDIVWSAGALPHMTPHDAARGLVRRADRIETGDSDEHR